MELAFVKNQLLKKTDAALMKVCFEKFILLVLRKNAFFVLALKTKLMSNNVTENFIRNSSLQEVKIKGIHLMFSRF